MITSDLASAGLTNKEGKLIVAGSMLAYTAVYTAVGPTNAAQMQPYTAAVCAGLTDAIGTPPPITSMSQVKALKAQLK